MSSILRDDLEGVDQHHDPIGAIRLVTTENGLDLVVGTSRNPNTPANVHVDWIDTTATDWNGCESIRIKYQVPSV